MAVFNDGIAETAIRRAFVRTAKAWMKARMIVRSRAAPGQPPSSTAHPCAQVNKNFIARK